MSSNLELVVSSLLELTDISKAFASVQALKGVSFALQAGEVHALVGENGAGKSTLIKVMTGAHTPDRGTITIRGKTIGHNNPVQSRKLGIAAIYQRPALFPDLTVAENIALGIEARTPWQRVHWTAIRQRARQLLDRIGASIDVQAAVRTLSMPEQQLVEIAKALGVDARIVIMDEPTASLTEKEVDRLFRIIADLKSQGVGIIYISHRLEELPLIADRVTALRDGICVGTRTMSDVSRDTLIQMMVGRDVSSIFPKTCVEPGNVVLKLRGLGCSATGVRDCDLEIRAGEIVGLAGLVGAGRSELARVLFGLTPADRGQILLQGRAVTVDSPATAVGLGIAYVPEDRLQHGVISEMSITSNVTLATLPAHARFGLLDPAREDATAQQFAKRLGVKASSIGAPVSHLSGGNQQKVALARWLATSPKLLILDEPTQGVDIGAKAEIHRILSELAREGLAILMISSELPEILAMSDRIGVMHSGTIVDELDRATATQEAILQRALGHVSTSHGKEVCA
jgi:rhamnose transport system ATP-binding protein